jgi:flagellar biosynthesis protein FlhB
MSDSEAEKTEEATPKKRDDAREEGRIPRSQELTVAASLLGSAAVLNAMAPVAGQGLYQIMGKGLASIGSIQLDSESATMLLRENCGMIGLSVNVPRACRVAMANAAPVVAAMSPNVAAKA